MIKVDQFCCGCSLKTGAIIVGVVYLIMGILYAFMGFVGFSGNIGIGGGQVVIIDSFGSHDVYDLGLASFIMGIVDILIASSLLYGAMKKSPTFLLPFLILIPFDLAVCWICLLAFGWFDISIILSLVIKTFISGYFWVCIFSFWNIIK